LEVTSKKSLHDLCGRKFIGKSPTTTFRASLGKFGQKSFAPPKICLLLYLCFEVGYWPATPIQQSKVKKSEKTNSWNLGRSQDFSKGGAEVTEAKALKRKN